MELELWGSAQELRRLEKARLKEEKRRKEDPYCRCRRRCTGPWPLAIGNRPVFYSCSGTRGVVGRYYLPTFASVVPSATADVSVDEIPIYDLSVGRRYVALVLGFLIPFTCLSM